jgi:YQGE family putative transporter
MFTSLTINIVATMIFFTGIMLGFCGFGYILGHLRLNAKLGFYFSFITFTLGLIVLGQVTTLVNAYIGMMLYGLSAGFFWLTVHTYELTETLDHERDFYSSVLSSGSNVIEILAPLCATGIIWLSVTVFHVQSLPVLFTLAPLFFLLGIRCFKGITLYRPERIDFKDITHFLFEKKSKAVQFYLGGDGTQHILHMVLLPLILFTILGTELRVGTYAIMAGVASIICTLILGHFRHRDNRVSLFGFAVVGICVFTTLLGIYPTLTILIIYTIGMAFLEPIKNVSSHVINLETMESIGREGKDFYATMILRDFSLWVWRMIAGGVLLVISLYVTSVSGMLSIGLYVLTGLTLLSFIGARILVKKMRFG